MKALKNGGNYALLALTLAFLLISSGCASISAEQSEEIVDAPPQMQEVTVEEIVLIDPPDGAQTSGASRLTRPVTTTITLSDGDIQIRGNGAQAQDNVLTITADGVYEISGHLSSGQILVNAPDAAKVELVLAGVDITSGTNAAIYCKSADELIITLAENTENALTDAVNYAYSDAVNEEPDAALFSKVDLNIGGSGSLRVIANFNHGISSKDDLVIEDGNYTVEAANHAIRGKDSLTVQSGNFVIQSGGDGLQSSNIERTDYGWVVLNGGSYTIDASGDGIQAATALTIAGGVYDITTSGIPNNDSNSQKGIKAGTVLTVDGGNYRLNTIDDGVHSNADVYINGGAFTIETGDDGIHADRALHINGGEIAIPDCYEGLEGTTVDIAGGKTFLRSSDDAISAAGGTDDTQGENSRRMANPDVYVRITGGEVQAVSGGDTIDANGYVYVEGGTLRLSAPVSPSWEGAILCNGDVTFTGGNVAVTGRVGVGVIAGGEQPVLLVSHTSQQAEGSIVSLRDENGDTLLEITSLQAYSDSAFSCPEMRAGSTYGLYVDDEKKLDITLGEGVTKISDDGSEFVGQYPRSRG